MFRIGQLRAVDLDHARLRLHTAALSDCYGVPMAAERPQPTPERAEVKQAGYGLFIYQLALSYAGAGGGVEQVDQRRIDDHSHRIVERVPGRAVVVAVGADPEALALERDIDDRVMSGRLGHVDRGRHAEVARRPGELDRLRANAEDD